MKTVKTTELKGAALDYAVAIAENQVYRAEFTPSTNWAIGGEILEREGIAIRQLKRSPFAILEVYHFTTEKGDVIEYMPTFKREMVRRPVTPRSLDNKWLAQICTHPDSQIRWSKTDFASDTPLVAAMRCFVASKLGDKVEILDFLL